MISVTYVIVGVAVVGVASLADIAEVASLADLAEVASSADIAEVASSAELAGYVTIGMTSSADTVNVVTTGVALQEKCDVPSGLVCDFEDDSVVCTPGPAELVNDVTPCWTGDEMIMGGMLFCPRPGPMSRSSVVHTTGSDEPVDSVAVPSVWRSRRSVMS